MGTNVIAKTDIKWTADGQPWVFAHTTGGFSSRSGYRTFGDVSGDAVAVDLKVFTTTKVPEAVWSDNVPTFGRVTAAPLGHEFSRPEMWDIETVAVPVDPAWRALSVLISDDRSRPALRGVVLTLDADHNVRSVVASDSYRLGWAGDPLAHQDGRMIAVPGEAWAKADTILVMPEREGKNELVVVSGERRLYHMENAMDHVTITRLVNVEPQGVYTVPDMAALKEAAAFAKTGNASMLFDCTQVSVETTVGRWVERCGSDGLAVGVRLNPAYVIDAVNVSGVSTFQHQGVSNAGYTDRPVLFAGEVVSVLLMPVRA